MKAHKKEPIAVSVPGNPVVILAGMSRRGVLVQWRDRTEPRVSLGT